LRSNAGNWDTGVLVNGDAVVFPAAASNKSNTNDLAGLSLASVTFQNNGYTISGNSLAVTGSFASNVISLTNTINNNLDLSTAGVIQFTGTGATDRKRQRHPRRRRNHRRHASDPSASSAAAASRRRANPRTS
jgi:hypothetical protein